MKRFEPEARDVMPPGFLVWFEEIDIIAEQLGAWALIGAWMRSPVEYCRFLVSLPGAWQGLIACAEWADKRRYEGGVINGRGVGV